MLPWVGMYYLRLSHSGGLRTENNHKAVSLPQSQDESLFRGSCGKLEGGALSREEYAAKEARL